MDLLAEQLKLTLKLAEERREYVNRNTFDSVDHRRATANTVTKLREAMFWHGQSQTGSHEISVPMRGEQ